MILLTPLEEISDYLALRDMAVEMYLVSITFYKDTLCTDTTNINTLPRWHPIHTFLRCRDHSILLTPLEETSDYSALRDIA